MSYSRKRKHLHQRHWTDRPQTFRPSAEGQTRTLNEPNHTLFIVAHEADIIRGPQAVNSARALETGPDDKEVGAGLIKWERSGSDDLGDVWVDRYDARLLLDALPALTSPTQSSSTLRPHSPSGWSDLPSDAEDTFFFTPEEAEDFRRDKRRRLIERGREERMRALQAEDDELNRPEEPWGGSDEEPDETQTAVMRRTASHILVSPNPAQLEMRILANHGADTRFAFLRGRWKRAWARTKGAVRQEMEAEKAKTKMGKGLGALMGYEESEEEDEDSVPEGDSMSDKLRSGESASAQVSEPAEVRDGEIVDPTQRSSAGEDQASEEAASVIMEARRARAREWAEKRRALKARAAEDGDGEMPSANSNNSRSATAVLAVHRAC
ncbi:hypothetical protein EW146_g9063 [Bondarzewia mesenterica]|uniref:Uncharacterized protein n=1 Tax=Bondarzewia mesenterica TaxID=1095465 RepID=A0A4S4L9J0_9AGAM|nr:hypothetical protein EW146_g9063 [Bondarzewia mesenterica]